MQRNGPGTCSFLARAGTESLEQLLPSLLVHYTGRAHGQLALERTQSVLGAAAEVVGVVRLVAIRGEQDLSGAHGFTAATGTDFRSEQWPQVGTDHARLVDSRAVARHRTDLLRGDELLDSRLGSGVESAVDFQLGAVGPQQVLCVGDLRAGLTWLEHLPGYWLYYIMA